MGFRIRKACVEEDILERIDNLASSDDDSDSQPVEADTDESGPTKMTNQNSIRGQKQTPTDLGTRKPLFALQIDGARDFSSDVASPSDAPSETEAIQ
jgi:hypothetical protein